ncbi:uncharacterized protein DS421_5g150730 [Arachis hypogaea]|nr:uncharacterized protein DS421_5g150730 [Arachis hypogaea]
MRTGIHRVKGHTILTVRLRTFEKSYFELISNHRYLFTVLISEIFFIKDSFD